MVAAVALVGAACGDDEEAADTTETTAAEAGGDDFDGATITASDYGYEIDGEIHASTLNVRAINDDPVAHEFAFVKLGDQTEDEFFDEFDEFNAARGEGPLPDAFFNGIVGPGGGELQPGEEPIEAEMSLSAGRWVLFCALTDADTETDEEGGGGGADGETQGQADEEEDGGEGEDEGADLPPHYRAGMFEVIDVEGSEEPTAPESGDGTVTIVDYAFEGLEDLEDGMETLNAVNSPDSAQLHHIEALDFGEGVSAEEAEAAFEAFVASEGGGEETEPEGGGGGADGETQGQAEPTTTSVGGNGVTTTTARGGTGATTTTRGGTGGEGGGPPGGAQPEELGGTFPLGPGYGTTFDISLESGNTYLFACFLSDREGGPPHAIGERMFKAFTIA